MENNITFQSDSAVSTEKIIRAIRAVRDQSIDDLLKESSLNSFLETHYDTLFVSQIKLEFMKRSLKELQNSSLDLAHYSSLIRKLKELSTVALDVNHPLFLNELKSLFERQGFKHS